MSSYVSLGLAILFEVIGTSLLKQTEQFTRLWPSLVVVATCAAAFYFLTYAIKTMPIGIAYAIWSGLGIMSITIIGLVGFKQHLDWSAYIGLGLILSGVVVIHVFSGSVGH